MKTAFRGYRFWTLGAIATLALLVTVSAFAEEEGGKRRWMLDMSHGALKTAIVESAGGNVSAYHYMTIKVTNPTQFPRPWNPLVKATTDTKDAEGNNRVYVAGGWSDALGKIQRRERNKNLRPINQTAGKLQPGETIETVAIFGPLDNLYDRIKLEIHGLADAVSTYKIEVYDSSEVADGDEIEPDQDWVIVDSAYWDRNQKIIKKLRAADEGGSLPPPVVDYVVVSERRFWGMEYERLGDEFRAEDDLINFVAEGWKIQGNPKKLRSVNKKSTE